MAVHAQTNYTLITKPAKTSLLGGHFIYRVDTTQGTLTPSSANIIENAADNPQQWGYNTHIGANGIKLRYNETTLSEWKANHLTFYKPGTNNPSLELISGVNTALNIYNPTNNTKTLGLDISGLNFYGTSTSTPDVTLNADGLTLINGSIRGGIVGQDEFLYLSPQVFADEYEEYILSEDTEVDETKTYYIRNGEEGEYIYTEISEPTGNPQENGYYEIAHAPGTIPIDNYVKNNWRQIIGRKFAVDTDGNLYANGLNANNAHLQQAEVEGAIVATSLTIGSGSDTYNGAAAINISGYSIEIEKDATDVEEDVSVYLYPILYHNGIKLDEYGLSDDTVVDTSKTYYTRSGEPGGYIYTEVQNPAGNPHNNNYYEKQIDYTHFVWYEDDITPGTTGDPDRGKILAFYNHVYKVTYDFDDGAVGGGTEIQTREVDPSKYITKTGDESITVHPEYWENRSSYISLNTDGLNIFNRYGNSIAQYGSTARIGLDNSSRFLMNSNSLEAYDSNNNKYFEVNSNGLSWGNNTAATTDDLIDAAKTATNYITTINNGGITIHSNDDNNEQNILMNTDGISLRNGLLPMMTLDNDSLDFNVIDTMNDTYTNVASLGEKIRLGRQESGYSCIYLDPSSYVTGVTELYRIIAKNNAEVMNIILDDDNYADEQEISILYDDHQYDLGRIDSLTSTTQTLSDSFSVGNISNIPIGKDFSVVINTEFWSRVADDGGGVAVSAIYDTYDSFTFVRGVASHPSSQQGDIYNFSNVVGNYTVDIQYDGNKTITLTTSATKTNEIFNAALDYSCIHIISYLSEGALLPIHRYHGDIYLNSQSIGGLYVGLDVLLDLDPESETYQQALNGDNAALWNAIYALGWKNDVMTS